MTCTAKRHGTGYAYKRYRCRCPDVVAHVNQHRSRTVHTKAVVPYRLGGDVDHVAVARACLGDRLVLSTAERNAAIDRLDARGLTAVQIARLVGCCDRTVTRRRVARRAASEMGVAA